MVGGVDVSSSGVVLLMDVDVPTALYHVHVAVLGALGVQRIATPTAVLHASCPRR